MNEQDWNRFDEKDRYTNNVLRGMDVANEFYIHILPKLESIYPDSNYHIFSQGNASNFENIRQLQTERIKLHVNESLEDTFCSLVFADVLVTAPSALSYCAGILNNNKRRMKISKSIFVVSN